MKRYLVAVLVVLAMLLAASAAFAAPALDSAQVKSTVQAMFDDYLKDLEVVTNIDSGTGNKEGIDKVAAFFTQKVETLGGTVEERPNKNGTHLTTVANDSKSFGGVLIMGGKAVVSTDDKIVVAATPPAISNAPNGVAGLPTSTYQHVTPATLHSWEVSTWVVSQ